MVFRSSGNACYSVARKKSKELSLIRIPQPDTTSNLFYIISAIYVLTEDWISGLLQTRQGSLSR